MFGQVPVSARKRLRQCELRPIMNRKSAARQAVLRKNSFSPRSSSSGGWVILTLLARLFTGDVGRFRPQNQAVDGIGLNGLSIQGDGNRSAARPDWHQVIIMWREKI